MEENIQNNKIEHVYIHIPFCVKKCNYCSFYSEIRKPFEKYSDAIKQEITDYQEKYKIVPKTIYFGGGTPSLLSPKSLQSIINLFDLSDNFEITIEANPITINNKYSEEISKTEINRVSLGVQSYLEKELKLLGRVHNTKDVDKAIDSLRKNGLNNINLDLIYGLPNQKKSEVIYSLNKIIEKNPNHISTYCLSLEKDVPLYFMNKDIPDDEEIADFYQTIYKNAEENGYYRYEISNFSREGFESRHNLSYWNLVNYLGIGAGASGFINNVRYKNHADIEKYIYAIENNKKKFTENKLSLENLKSEYIFLGLRKASGISIENYRKRYGKSIFADFEKIINKYIENGFLILKDDTLKLAKKSYFISNEIFSDFLI